MRPSSRLASLVALLALSPPPAAEAYRRLKLGPLELVPSFSVEVKQHSNIYVTSKEAGERATEQDDQSIFERSGILLDVRPGLILSAKPDLQKRIHGLFLDLRYKPTLIFYPDAPEELELLPPDGEEVAATRPRPDQFKLDHTVLGTLRYQVAPTVTLATGLEYTHPELSQGNERLDDLKVRGGGKLDFTRTLSLEATATWQRFVIPGSRARGVDDSVAVEDSPLGTFDGIGYEGSLLWRLRPTLTAGAVYGHVAREYPRLAEGVTARPPGTPEGSPTANDFNDDGIPDRFKDYGQHTLQGQAVQRLSRTARGTVRLGYLWRAHDDRQFGARDYSTFTGQGTVDTLLGQRTRLQASAEYTLVDTVREITFADLNAFTSDQIGQFAIIPEQYSVAFNQRYLLDLVQNVFRRGDQVLLGLGWQLDDLRDQQGGSGNLFVPGTPFVRSECIGTPGGRCAGLTFLDPLLPDATQRLLIASAGYRVRVKRFLGIQARVTWFKGVRELETTAAYERELDLLATPGARPDGRLITREQADRLLAQVNETEENTDYWSVSGGLVVNLQVFQ